MSHNAVPKSPLHRYRQFGDRFADADELHQLRADIGEATGWGGIAESHLYIDLAVAAPKKQARYLAKAKEVAERVISEHAQPLRNPEHASIRAEALITLAQIPTWDAILSNDPEKLPSYPQTLAISKEIAVVSRGSAKAITKATEFVPIILGNRTLEYDLHDSTSQVGWIGRAALLREDQRATKHTQRMAGVGSHNWDLGASLDTENPNLLQFPPYRIQKKLGYSPKDGEYAKGIVPIVARSVGTSNVRNIIYACIAEYEGKADSPMTSDELDKVTFDIFAHIKPVDNPRAA